MVHITQSLKEFFIRKNMMSEMSLLLFGHLEVYTPEIKKEYMEWLQSEEGQAYLKEGEKYDAEYGQKLDNLIADGSTVLF